MGTHATRHANEAGSSSCRLDVTWRVEVPGREPYRFSEMRLDAPAWLLHVGGPTGKRWYSFRVKPQTGLLPRLGVPCFVDPANPDQLWLDWDASWDEHVPAWEQDAAVRIEVDRRRGGIEGALGRVFHNPLARHITPEEEVLVQQAQEAEARREEHYRQEAIDRMAAEGGSSGFVLASPEEAAEQERQRLDAERIYNTGREVQATVVANEPTGRTLAAVPTFLITFDLDDGGVHRRVDHEYIWGPRVAKRYKVGKAFPVRIDPDDPNRITPAK